MNLTELKYTSNQIKLIEERNQENINQFYTEKNLKIIEKNLQEQEKQNIIVDYIYLLKIYSEQISQQSELNMELKNLKEELFSVQQNKQQEIDKYKEQIKKIKKMMEDKEYQFTLQEIQLYDKLSEYQIQVKSLQEKVEILEDISEEYANQLRQLDFSTHETTLQTTEQKLQFFKKHEFLEKKELLPRTRATSQGLRISKEKKQIPKKKQPLSP